METSYTMDIVNKTNEVIYESLLEDGFMPVEEEE